MKTRFGRYFIVLAVLIPLIGVIGLRDALSFGKSKECRRPTPERQIQKMLYDLCDIAGYGIHSGTNRQPKANRAAYYILNALKRRGVRAKLEPITANSPYPKNFEMIAEVEDQPSRTITCFPLQWTLGTSSTPRRSRRW